LRAPIRFLDAIRCRTLIIEGDSGRVNNVDALRALREATDNPNISFHVARGADHFSVLAPINELLGRQIAADEPLSLGD
jgi:hypothetical protein